MTVTCILDGDIISYRAAAANESRSILATHKATGVVSKHAHRTALKEHIKGSFELDEFDVQDVQEPGELRFALHSMKVTIENILEACGAEQYEVYISGDSNFRDDLPLPTRYKSGREGLLRPTQLVDCREYLEKHHGAERCHGYEADDMLAQRAYEGLKNGEKVIATGLDKDANGQEGWLYNWLKMDKPILVRGLGHLELEDKKKLRGLGRKWFYAQWVLGDVTDGFRPNEICGKKFGDVAAYKLLNDCKTDQECVQAVYNQYKKWYPAEVVYTDWTGKQQTTDAVGLMGLYADCCHMRRWPGDKLNVPALLTKLKIAL